MGFGTVVAASAPVLTNPAVARPSGTPLIPAITTVYVGKIAPTVEDDFIRRLLDVSLFDILYLNIILSNVAKLRIGEELQILSQES